MRRFTACFLLAVGGLATTASAATCVSNTFDRPFPGATEVETRHADVPSSRFPGLWQQGHIDGFVYRIWSNEDAVLQSGGAAPTWTILVTCGGSETECRQTVDGAPPAAALTVADELALCLSDPDYAGRPPGTPLDSGTSVTSAAEDPGAPASATADAITETPEEPVTPPTAAAEEPTPPAADATGETAAEPTEACGVAGLPDGPIGLTLQRLLVEAGANPGPLDGMVGPMTYRALVEVLGEPASDRLGHAEAVAALDRMLCGERD